MKSLTAHTLNSDRMLKIYLTTFILMAFFNVNYLNAQTNNEEFARDTFNCEKIKITDSLTVHAGDFVLDKKMKIDINKTLLDSTNIKNIITIPNPCSNIGSGYKGAYVIERKNENPLVPVSELVKEYKNKYPDFSYYNVVLNNKLTENYEGYLIEVTKGFTIHIILDKLRERKLTILINQ